MGNIPLQLPNSFDDFENFLLGSPSSLFAVTGRCIGTVLSVLCCFFLSEIPRLRFARFVSSLLLESLVAGKEQQTC